MESVGDVLVDFPGCSHVMSGNEAYHGPDLQDIQGESMMTTLTVIRFDHHFKDYL